MASFTISAPGRIVLSGEHSARYRKHFVAASLNCRTNLNFWESCGEEEFIEINFPSVDLLEQTIILDKVRTYFAEHRNLFANPINVHNYVNFLITMNCSWNTLQQRYSLKVFFFLLYTIAYMENLEIRSFHVNVTTEIPLDSGLGSSTSFTVCLAACFLHWKNLQTGNPVGFDSDVFLKKVKTYSKLCEKLLQDYNYVSVDTKVCIYGRLVKSHLIDYTRFHTDFYDMTEMKIVLIKADVSQTKACQAKQMAELKCEFIEFDDILNQLDIMAKELHRKLLQLSNLQNEEADLLQRQNCFNSLKICILHNQRFLEEYHLSAPPFNHICATVNNSYSIPGKLTGFGSKYVYLVLPPSITDEQVDFIENNLRENNNFCMIHTSIKCDGLKLHD